MCKQHNNLTVIGTVSGRARMCLLAGHRLKLPPNPARLQHLTAKCNTKLWQAHGPTIAYISARIQPCSSIHFLISDAQASQSPRSHPRDKMRGSGLFPRAAFYVNQKK
jgi:hypothetical protein